MDLLILGGSGFLSGTLARLAVGAGHRTTVVTRGNKPLPDGVEVLTVDRSDREGFRQVMAAQGPWDLVVDCIGFSPEDAHQDVQCFAGRCRHLVFVSTDFVYDPLARSQPQPEDPAVYSSVGYGGNKRQAENVFLQTDPGDLPWTIFRPSHIYGPGSQLGCLPLHGRDPDLIDRLLRGEPLRLVGDGAFLQHPVFAPDLCRSMLSVVGNLDAVGQVFNISNPDVIPSRTYYEVVADILGVKVAFAPVDVKAFLADHPDKAPFCCDRSYDLGRLQASGLYVPHTSLRDGLAQQMAFLRG